MEQNRKDSNKEDLLSVKKAASSDAKSSQHEGELAKKFEFIHPGPTKEQLHAIFHSIPSQFLLFESGGRKVFIFDKEILEHISPGYYFLFIDEIGRLREETFRTVGLGTRQARDIDRYDEYYKHLIVWDEKNQEIVGAYRLGLVKEIIKKYGIKGLFSSIDFHYKPEFFRSFKYDAIELGRAFIRKEGEGKLDTALLLLWKGIGKFLSQNPKHRILIGALSISQNYSSLSKALMVWFCQQHDHPVLAQCLQNQFVPKFEDVSDDELSVFKAKISNVKELGKCVREIEGKSIPQFLISYAEMGSHFFGFASDASFNCLDVGVVLDLVDDFYNKNPILFKKLVGSKETEEYINFQNSNPTK